MSEAQAKVIIELALARKDGARLKTSSGLFCGFPYRSRVDRFIEAQPEEIPAAGSRPFGYVAEVLPQGVVHCLHSVAIYPAQFFDV